MCDQNGDSNEPGGVRHAGVSADDDVMSDPILLLAGRGFNLRRPRRTAQSDTWSFQGERDRTAPLGVLRVSATLAQGGLGRVAL